MKIIITNVYCYKNKGDAGIIVSMIENLKKRFDNPEIELVSLYPEMDRGNYDDEVKVLPPILKQLENSNKYILLMKNVIKLIYKYILYSFSIFKTETEKEISTADLVISCGGGYMQARDIKQLVTGFIYHYIQLICAKKSRRKYIIFAQTIGPFDKLSKKIIYPVLKEAQLVLAREQISYEYVKNNFDIHNLHLTADVAFLLSSTHANNSIIDGGSLKVGITVRKWTYPGVQNRDEMNLRYIESFSMFIDWIIETYGACVYIMPQCIGPETDNDLIISKEVFGKVKNKKNCKVIEEDFKPTQLKGLYSQLDYFVGTRMHSNIFALSEYKPCLAISYDYKTDGIMQLVSMEDYVLNINCITFIKMKTTFEKLLNDNEIANKLIPSVNAVKEMAEKNFSMIKLIS